MSDLEFKLYYFPMAGKGEALRLALHYAGIKFENFVFTTMEQFAEMKVSQDGKPAKLMFGQVPALEVTDKKTGKVSVLTQSAAILRFIARISPESGLTPRCPVQAAYADAICDQEADALQGIRVALYKSRFGFDCVDDESIQKIKDKINDEILPKHFAMLEKKLEVGGSNWLAGTEKPSIADFQWGGIVPTLKSGYTGKKWEFKDYPKLDAFVDRFFELDEVKDWYKNNTNYFA